MNIWDIIKTDVRDHPLWWLALAGIIMIGIIVT
jgi:hypothetical protein